jgi:ABC-2 type transport system ATP-binding protein
LGTSFIIDIENLSYVYSNSGVKALSSLSVQSDMKSGILAILGPNGAGKTTLVNVMTTSMPLQTGKIKIFGYDIARNRDIIRSLIALCAQGLELDLLLSIKANLWSYGLIRGMKKETLKKRIDYLLELFQMKEKADRRVLQLSGGEMRRVQLMRTFLDETAKLLFIDEPTLGLDPLGRKVTWELIKEWVEKEHYFILTTNDMAEVERLSSEIVFLYKGQKLAETTVEEFKKQYAGRIKINIKTGNENSKACIRKWSSKNKVNVLHQSGHTFTLECKDILIFLDLLSEISRKGGEIEGLSLQQETLEDAFINLIEKMEGFHGNN